MVKIKEKNSATQGLAYCTGVHPLDPLDVEAPPCWGWGWDGVVGATRWWEIGYPAG